MRICAEKCYQQYISLNQWVGKSRIGLHLAGDRCAKRNETQSMATLEWFQGSLWGLSLEQYFEYPCRTN